MTRGLITITNFFAGYGHKQEALKNNLSISLIHIFLEMGGVLTKDGALCSSCFIGEIFKNASLLYRIYDILKRNRLVISE